MFLQRYNHRNYKYSNPLAGTVYNNQQFLSHCQTYLDTDLKLSTTTTEDLDLKTTSIKRTSQGFRPLSRQVTIRQVHSANNPFERSQKPLHKQHDHPSHPHLTDRGNLTTAGSKGSRQFQTKRTSLVETCTSQNNVGTKLSQRRTLKRKLAINPFVDGYLFPSVQIRIIHKITSVASIQSQSISFSFQKIFKRLIRTQIMGQFTSNFMFKMEHYLRRIVEKDQIYQNPLGIQLEQSVKTISRKQDLLDLILELELEGNTPKVEEIIKYYCIPPEKVAQLIFKELIDDIVIEIFEKKNCSKDIQYCLLSQEGNRIVHLSQIFFSTRCLLMALESTFCSDFERYRKMLQQHDKEQRMTFKQSIKHNFVNKIVFNKLEQNLINYTAQPKEQVHHRKEIIEQAETLLLSKSRLRLQRNRPSPNKELSLGDLKFEEPAFTRQTLYNSYTQRKFNEKKQYKEIISKLHRILDPNNNYSVKSKLDQRTEEEFSKLHRLNEEYDISYLHNHGNSNKLLLQNMLNNCHIFKTKTQSQIKKIVSVIEKIYGGQNRNLKEVQSWQFKQIFQTAHGVSQPNLIMKFVISYLNFDEWGQIQKKELFKVLQMALPLKGRPLELVRSIVWNWLQRCKLVQNGVLRKRNIEIWYQPVRVVYLLFLSIIFGTEYQSFQQMLSELFKYQFY